MSCRILHVTGSMERGGIQSWLLHLLQTVDRQHYQMDFLVHTEEPCAYDRDIIELGSTLLRCSRPRNPWQYARDFTKALRTEKGYDIIHSHVYSLNGLVLRLASRYGIPLRIAHSHDDRRVVEAGTGLIRHCQLWLMKSWIDRYANVKIAVSNDAAEDLFGPEWKNDPATRIIHCGIDLSPFRVVPDEALRASLGLPADALVIGHVGRFVTQKNHQFLIKVVAEAVKRDPRVRLLLVGSGPLRQDVEQGATALGIAKHIVYLGERDDVPAIMSAAMDVFVFPSLHEGLGLVLVEAQAAGLPCLISDCVPREADVVPGLICRLPLDHGPASWARRLLEVSATARVNRAEALAAVERSSFNITRSVGHITRIYDGKA
jgi:glycosyltransferase involved in cell wall biosynthesis